MESPSLVWLLLGFAGFVLLLGLAGGDDMATAQSLADWNVPRGAYLLEVGQ